MMRQQTAAVRWPYSDASRPPRLGRASCLPRPADHHRLRRASPRLMAVADALVSAPAAVTLPDDFMQDRIEFLKCDMANLFTAMGPDRSAYEERVVFRDPISTYSSLSSFLLNLRFLRAVFGPELVLHDVQRTGGSELTCRWTMRMTVQLLKHFSVLRRRWYPELLFTGISVMQINPQTGRFCSSVDHWDAIEDRSYPSFAAVRHVAAQMFNAAHTSDGWVPAQYSVLRRFADCEVRRYERPPLAADGSSDAARWPTTEHAQAASAGVSGQQAPQLGGHFAAMTLWGNADEMTVSRKVQLLRRVMAARGLRAQGPDYLLVAQEQAVTRAALRRNDVLVQLQSFELW